MKMSDRAKKDEWVARVLGLSLVGNAQPDVAAATADSQMKSALAGWSKARLTAMTSLKALEAAIRNAKHASGDKAIILVKAISANLTAQPDTKNSIAELRNYLENDRIIEEAEEPNGFGVYVDLRRPLLASLQEIDWALAAT